MGVKAILASMGQFADAEISFSRHAGCTMCPCSPGFIAKNGTGIANRNFWVEINYEAPDFQI